MIKSLIPFGRNSHDAIRKLRVEGDGGMRQRDWPRAIEAYGSYLAQRPGDAAILVQYGHALKESGRFEEALAAYRRALDAAPQDEDARLHLDALLERLSQRASGSDVARHRPRDAHAQGNGVPQVRDSTRAYASPLSRGDAERGQQNWRAAALAYCEHLNDKPTDAAIWVQLGHMLKEQMLFEDALYAYKVAKRLETEPSDVSLHLAFLLMRAGKSTEATPLWADMFRKENSFFLQGT